MQCWSSGKPLVSQGSLYMCITFYSSTKSLFFSFPCYVCQCGIYYSFTKKCFLNLFLTIFQVCSDINKPNGQFILQNDRSTVMTFISSLPIRKVCDPELLLWLSISVGSIFFLS